MPSGLQNNIQDIFLKIHVPSLRAISRKMFHVRLLSVWHKNLYGCELLTLNEKLLVSSFVAIKKKIETSLAQCSSSLSGKTSLCFTYLTSGVLYWHWIRMDPQRTIIVYQPYLVNFYKVLDIWSLHPEFFFFGTSNLRKILFGKTKQLQCVNFFLFPRTG